MIALFDTEFGNFDEDNSNSCSLNLRSLFYYKEDTVKNKFKAKLTLNILFATSCFEVILCYHGNHG